MKKYKLVIVSIMLCFIIVNVAGCFGIFPSGDEQSSSGVEFPSLGGGGPQSSGGTVHESVAGVSDRLTTEEEKIIYFSNGDLTGFRLSNGYSNGAPFDCFWSSSSVRFEVDRMLMSVQEATNNSGGYKYIGAECCSWVRNYSYGFYSVSMKAAKCSGVISSFFTYTNNGGWDEIDIEFLGKDTTGIQLNYYTKGVGGHEFWYDLGFDGADDFHEYAFLWLENSITWYVDGKAIYRAIDNIPNLPTQIMMNVWNCVGHDEWSGRFDPTALPATAEYKWIGYSAAK